MARANKASKAVDFEAAMRDLEDLVEKMEQGEFSLEESIKQFERGIKLARSCHQALREAEQKVSKLATPDVDSALEPLTVPDDD